MGGRAVERGDPVVGSTCSASSGGLCRSASRRHRRSGRRSPIRRDAASSGESLDEMSALGSPAVVDELLISLEIVTGA